MWLPNVTEITMNGLLVALVTPMTDSGAVDYQALDRLVDWHLECKTDALVILGTTGESATLSHQEKEVIIRRVIQRVDARIPVWVGTGTNSTQTTIELTTQAAKLGAAGALVVTPYYNKPTQEGLFQHFSMLASSTTLPIMLYNVPSRTAVDLQIETVSRLSRHDNIVAIKDATGDLSRLPQLLETGLNCLSGDDGTACEFILKGGHGVVSVIGNTHPDSFGKMVRAALEGNDSLAQELNLSFATWYRALSIETNPIPVKWILHKMNKIGTGIRLPLQPLSSSSEEVLYREMGELLDLSPVVN